MKRTLFLTLVFCIAISETFAQFVHPGMLHNKQDLDFLRTSVKSGVEPIATSWRQLKASPEADLNWQARPIKVIVVGFYSKPDIGATDFRKDGDAA